MHAVSGLTGLSVRCMNCWVRLLLIWRMTISKSNLWIAFFRCWLVVQLVIVVVVAVQCSQWHCTVTELLLLLHCTVTAVSAAL